MERLHGVVVGGFERHVGRRDGIVFSGGGNPHRRTVFRHECLNARESGAPAVAQRRQGGLVERLLLVEILHLDGHMVDHDLSFHAFGALCIRIP